MDVFFALQDAAAAVKVLGPTAASSSVDSAISTVAAAGLMSYIIEWAKRSHLIPWMTTSTKAINRFVNGVLALFAAFTIHYAFDFDSGTLTITGLTAGNVAHGIWEWAKQWAFQQMAYDGVVDKSDTNG